MTELTVELVPATSWGTNVRTLLTPAEWGRCKQFVRDRSGSQCEICGGRGRRWPVECHEVWQYDDDQHLQTLAGLIALCPSCHEVKHFGFAEARGRFAPAMAHLQRVTGMSKEEALAYLGLQFVVWRERSEHPWHVNLWYLANEPALRLDVARLYRDHPEGT